MKEEIDYNTLLVRFFERTADEADIKHLSEWINSSEENKRIFNEYNESYQLADITANGWLYNTDNNWKKLKVRIQDEGMIPLVKMVTNRQMIWWRSVAVIAIIMTVAALGWMFKGNQQLSHYSGVVSVVAPLGQKSQVVLQDGSKVWLNSGSKLEYVYSAETNQRVATLEGEAFFDVAKDSNTPFIVETPDVVLKVYGTRFNVLAYAEEQIVETTLEEGSLGVQIKTTGEELLMKPGQQVIFNKQSKLMELSDVNLYKHVAWKNGKLHFDNDTFIEVVKKLERWYGVEIHLDESLHLSARYTMIISSESVSEVLDLMKITTPMRYEIRNGQIEIIADK